MHIKVNIGLYFITTLVHRTCHCFSVSTSNNNITLIYSLKRNSYINGTHFTLFFSFCVHYIFTSSLGNAGKHEPECVLWDFYITPLKIENIKKERERNALILFPWGNAHTVSIFYPLSLPLLLLSIFLFLISVESFATTWSHLYNCPCKLQTKFLILSFSPNCIFIFSIFDRKKS